MDAPRLDAELVALPLPLPRGDAVEGAKSRNEDTFEAPADNCFAAAVEKRDADSVCAAAIDGVGRCCCCCACGGSCGGGRRHHHHDESERQAFPCTVAPAVAVVNRPAATVRGRLWPGAANKRCSAYRRRPPLPHTPLQFMTRAEPAARLPRTTRCVYPSSRPTQRGCPLSLRAALLLVIVVVVGDIRYSVLGGRCFRPAGRRPHQSPPACRPSTERALHTRHVRRQFRAALRGRRWLLPPTTTTTDDDDDDPPLTIGGRVVCRRGGYVNSDDDNNNKDKYRNGRAVLA